MGRRGCGGGDLSEEQACKEGEEKNGYNTLPGVTILKKRFWQRRRFALNRRKVIEVSDTKMKFILEEAAAAAAHPFQILLFLHLNCLQLTLGEGFPRAQVPPPPHLFSRIIKTTDMKKPRCRINPLRDPSVCFFSSCGRERGVCLPFSGTIF